jgi:predicted nucleotidyltransferase component of viral defense system
VAILTEFQQRFLREFSATPLRESFYLTGGTALSAFYLQHRYSEDLDFFTEEPGMVSRVLPVLEKLVRDLETRMEVRRQFRSYLECFIDAGRGEILRCDFAEDAPFRLQERTYQAEYGIYVDNALDMACNKLSALYDRTEAKDFVDVYFIDKEIIRLEDLFPKAKQKHVGLDDYWLAVSFAKAEEFVKLPRMAKPVEVEDLKRFFREKALWLMSRR